MNIIRNINIDELIEILSSIRKTTQIVDMEVDDGEKTVVFVPVIKQEGQEEKTMEDEITKEIKRMKKEFENNKTDTNVPVSKAPKINLNDLTKLI
jgi:predicted xylose isomerase-like sugar epimerase